MPFEDVDEQQEQQEEQQVEKPAKGGKGAKEPETETISKAELASLRRERDEARESERFWADRAKSGKPAPVEREEEEEENDDDPDPANDTLVDDFSTKGVKALLDRGFITKKAAKEIAAQVAKNVAKQMIGQAQRKATTDQKIMGAFPELNDPKSELFKLTREELREMVDLDPDAAKSPTALYAAAKAAKARLDAKKAPPKRTRRDDYEYEGDEGEDEEEADRLLRADAQGARRGRGSRGSVDDDYLPSQTRQVLALMNPEESEADRIAMFRQGQKRSK